MLLNSPLESKTLCGALHQRMPRKSSFDDGLLRDFHRKECQRSARGLTHKVHTSQELKNKWLSAFGIDGRSLPDQTKRTMCAEITKAIARGPTRRPLKTPRKSLSRKSLSRKSLSRKSLSRKSLSRKSTFDIAKLFNSKRCFQSAWDTSCTHTSKELAAMAKDLGISSWNKAKEQMCHEIQHVLGTSYNPRAESVPCKTLSSPDKRSKRSKRRRHEEAYMDGLGVLHKFLEAEGPDKRAVILRNYPRARSVGDNVLWFSKNLVPWDLSKLDEAVSVLIREVGGSGGSGISDLMKSLGRMDPHGLKRYVEHDGLFAGLSTSPTSKSYKQENVDYTTAQLELFHNQNSKRTLRLDG